MRLRSLLILIFLVAPWSASLAQAAGCLQPGDSSQVQIEALTSVMRASDTSSTFLRNQVGLAGLDTADMVLVTQDSICAQVDSALRVASKSTIPMPWVVYRLGSNRFAAFCPGPRSTSIYFIDDQKKLLSILL